jgi:serine/threonine-protein kinase
VIELERGTVFAGYVIDRLLGTGGMGSVYLARHPHLPKREALKLLRPELCRDPVFAGRFDREAETVAGLSHPHILPVHDRGSENGQLWISMPFVDGRDAAAAVQANPGGLPPEFAVHILGHIGSALDYAHRRKLLHRDVKPANILLTAAPEDGDPEWAFLTDFGIAKSVEEVGRLTAAGDVVATFQYASPEQIDGKPLDHRSDIYSLGCVLYELLTGRPPYPGMSVAAAIQAHLQSPPPRPTDVRPGLPAAFDQVIATAMAKSPQERNPSCRALPQHAQPAWASAPGVPTPVTGTDDPDPAGSSPSGPRSDRTRARAAERLAGGTGPDTQRRSTGAPVVAVSLAKAEPPHSRAGRWPLAQTTTGCWSKT